MKGDIYTRQRCPVCGGRLVHEPKRSGLFCPAHPDQRASARFFVRFGKEVNRQFATYERASRFLNGLRFEEDQGRFDPLDHRAACPYAFDHLAAQYLEEKLGKRNIPHQMGKAVEFFGQVNVKDLKRRHFNEFLRSLDVSDKTKANYLATLGGFFRWALDEEHIEKAPNLPKVDYDLGLRPIISLEVQQQILDTIREQTRHNAKIHLAIDLLRTYLMLRPDDIRRIREKDILDNGMLVIWRPTKRRAVPRMTPLLPEHIEQIEAIQAQYPGVPDLPFFRWNGDEKNNRRPGAPFGSRLLYKTWKTACEEVGVKGVDLYGGTRHSSATALTSMASHEDIKALTGHGTNKAFDRYCQAGSMTVIDTVRKLRGGDKVVTPDFKNKKVR